MSESDGFVYKWTNKVSGRWYIGSHKGSEDDGYTGSGIQFQRAVKTYGIEKFEREILYRGAQYREEEERILKELDAALDERSYNLKNEAFGASLSGELNGMSGKNHTIEAKEAISKTLIDLWDDERKAEHSKKMSGRGNPMFGISRVGTFSWEKMIQTKRMKQEDWGFLKGEKHHRTTFLNIFRDLKRWGKNSSPRGQLILELENYSYTLPPYVRFQNFESRKMNLPYTKEEFLWYLKGDKFDQSICEKAKIWKDIVNSDGSINSNYGQYIFHGEDNQFDNVVRILKEDRDSRRASISILSKDHLLSDTKDVPCTYSMNFRIREGKLNMTVHMRSQDAIYGMASDAPCFSFIHEMLLNALREFYPDLEYGDYFHFVDSLHVYQRHFAMLDKLLAVDKTTKGDVYKLVLCPKISGPKEVTFLRQYTALDPKDRREIPKEFMFTKWLTGDDMAVSQQPVEDLIRPIRELANGASSTFEKQARNLADNNGYVRPKIPREDSLHATLDFLKGKFHFSKEETDTLTCARECRNKLTHVSLPELRQILWKYGYEFNVPSFIEITLDENTSNVDVITEFEEPTSLYGQDAISASTYTCATDMFRKAIEIIEQRF